MEKTKPISHYKLKYRQVNLVPFIELLKLTDGYLGKVNNERLVPPRPKKYNFCSDLTNGKIGVY